MDREAAPGERARGGNHSCPGRDGRFDSDRDPFKGSHVYNSPIYLHHLHASDEDRALHDHPWSFIAVLLSNGYWEWIQVKGGLRKVWRRRLSVLWRPAEWQHRLELVQPTWTLVLRFRRRREWGFWTAMGWLDYRAYGKEWCD